MTADAAPLTCPFCRTELSPRDAVCRGCQATRHVRTGMSPRGFAWFVGTWLALAVPTVLLAAWVALVPWLPHGEGPGYALALAGARPEEPPPRCRVEVVDASGRHSEALADGPCGAAAPSPAASAPTAGGARRAAAAALHSALSLAGGALLAWAMLKLLRRRFLRRAAPSWVQRAAA